MAAAENNAPADGTTTKKSGEEEKENGYEVGNDGEEKKPKKTVADVRCMMATKMHNVGNMLWNAEKKEVIGRTWKSWAKIGLFYLVFYSCLALFFAIMLAGFFATLDSRAPTQKGLYSLIKANPGMGFKPMPNTESTLIKFRQGEESSYRLLTANIDEFFKAYNKTRESTTNSRNCSLMKSNMTLEDPRNEFCEFDLHDLGTECTAKNNYGYNNNKPCVLLKINKVYGWQPRAFTQEELADTNNHFAQEAKQKLGDRIDPDYIGVTCEGENEGDADNLRGVNYYPRQGFSFKHYPYFNQPNYQPPLVFVQFDTPREGALIQIWCRLWVSNIKHHKNDKAGSIHFELLVN